MYITTTMCDGVLHCLWFAPNVFLVSLHGGVLPDIILWTQCYLHRGTCLNAMKWFCICSLLILPKRFDIFSPITGGCSEGLGVVWFFFKQPKIVRHRYSTEYFEGYDQTVRSLQKYYEI